MKERNEDGQESFRDRTWEVKKIMDHCMLLRKFFLSYQCRMGAKGMKEVN